MLPCSSRNRGSIRTSVFLISIMFARVAVAMVIVTVGLVGGNMGIRGIALFFASHRNSVASVGIGPSVGGCVYTSIHLLFMR